MTVGEPWLGIAAFAMAAIFGGLIDRWSRAQTQQSASLILLGLGAATGVLVGGYVALADTGSGGVEIGVWVVAALTAIFGFPLYVVRAREATSRQDLGTAYLPRPVGTHLAYSAGVSLLVVAAGFVTAADLELAAGAAVGWYSGTVGSLANDILATLCSSWFVLPMTAEMVVALVLVGRRLPPVLRPVLAVQAASLLASPTALGGGLWAIASSIAAGVLMLTLYAYVTALLSSYPHLETAIVDYTMRLVAVYALIAAGLVVWGVVHTPVVLGLATAGLALLFWGAIASPRRFSLSSPAAGATGTPPGPPARLAS